MPRSLRAWAKKLRTFLSLERRERLARARRPGARNLLTLEPLEERTLLSSATLLGVPDWVNQSTRCEEAMMSIQALHLTAAASCGSEFIAPRAAAAGELVVPASVHLTSARKPKCPARGGPTRRRWLVCLLTVSASGKARQILGE
jgi:hypothetical protein